MSKQLKPSGAVYRRLKDYK